MYVQTFSFQLLASVLKRELVSFCCYFGAEESLIITLELGYCMTISTVVEQLAATVFVSRKTFYHRLHFNHNAWILSLRSTRKHDTTLCPLLLQSLLTTHFF